MGGSGKNPRYAVAISRDLEIAREGKEVSRKYVCDDDIAVAERFRFRAKQPLVMMVIVMGIFYVMLILPQQRQRKKLQEMLSTLKAGDKVITNGGIYGVINGIDGDTVILKIADTGSSPVKIRIARSAITQVEASEDAK